jgi:hypothetical protein
VGETNHKDDADAAHEMEAQALQAVEAAASL